jgi:hypothetical protein
MPSRYKKSRVPILTDVLFHVERSGGRVDEFRKGDLAIYVDSVVTIVDVPDTVMGHFVETTQGGIICLDVATVLLNGKIVVINTEKLFPINVIDEVSSILRMN